MGVVTVARQVAAAVLAWAVAVALWLALDDIPVRAGFDTPIPYVMLVATAIGLPLQAALAPWHRWKIMRLLGLGSLATLPAHAAFWSAFLPGRALFASSMAMGCAWLAVTVFWLFAKGPK